jgi:hypothetical protein
MPENKTLARFNECVEQLCNQAKSQPGRYPVSEDHCFLRIIYDAVVGDKWDRKVKRPARKNLTEEQMQQCLALGQQLLNNPVLCKELQEQSLGFRKRKF